MDLKARSATLRNQNLIIAGLLVMGSGGLSACSPIALVGVGVVAAASGGGGGGGGGGAAPSADPGPTVSGPASGTLSFPAAESTSVANSSQLTITGTAVNAAAVTVNGVPATSSNGFAAWSADVPLQFGLNQVSVSITDGQGITFNAARTFVFRQETVMNFRDLEYDEQSRQMFLFDSSFRAAVLRGDGVSALEPLLVGPGVEVVPRLLISMIALDAANRQMLVLDRGLNRLLGVDLQTRAVTVIASAGVGNGPFYLQEENLAVTSDGTRAFVAAISPQQIFEVDLATGNRTAYPTNRRFVGSMLMSPDDQSLLTLQLDSLFSVDPVTGDEITISGPGVGAGPAIINSSRFAQIALDGTRTKVLILDDNERLLSVDLATGDRTVLVPESASPLLTAQLSGLTFAANPDRVLFSDFRGRVAEIQLASGNKRILYGQVGDGVRMGEPARVVRDPDQERVFALDTEEKKILTIDLRNGQRELVSGLGRGSGPLIDTPLELALDTVTRQTLYVVDGLDNSLISVDIASGDRQLISSDSKGTGPSIIGRGLAIDNGRALTVGGAQGELIAIDLASGQRNLLVTGGSGPNTLPIGRFIFDAPTSTIYAFQGLGRDLRTERLFAIDAISGDRSLISASSSPPDPRGEGPFFGIVSTFALDRARSRFIIADKDRERLLSTDIATGNRVIRSVNTGGRGPAFVREESGLVLDQAGGRALIVDVETRSLIAIEPNSGDRIVISR